MAILFRFLLFIFIFLVVVIVLVWEHDMYQTISMIKHAAFLCQTAGVICYCVKQV